MEFERNCKKKMIMEIDIWMAILINYKNKIWTMTQPNNFYKKQIMLIKYKHKIIKRI